MNISTRRQGWKLRKAVLNKVATYGFNHPTECPEFNRLPKRDKTYVYNAWAEYRAR